jgi:hypothetical protein
MSIVGGGGNLVVTSGQIVEGVHVSEVSVVSVESDTEEASLVGKSGEGVVVVLVVNTSSL